MNARAIVMLLGLGLLVPVSTVRAAGFEMTPTVLAQLKKEQTVIVSWAAEPVIVNAVREQNKKGKIAGMDNETWKVTRRTDPVIRAFQINSAGQFLKAKLYNSGGGYSEAFLNAAQGEKVAFVEKPTSYIHKGKPKFDVPVTTGKPWQGEPEFDESTQTYAVQISVPVLADGKSIGALVVGVNLSYLERFKR